MRRLGFLLLVLLPSLPAAQPDYFPLQTGNQWTYRPTRFGQPFTVEVTGTAEAAGQSYFVVEGFPGGTVWMRMSDEGTLYAYNPGSKVESVWAAFGAAEGQRYATGIGPCNSIARIRAKSTKLEIPIGQFDTALTIEYPPSGCADAGLTGESYLPHIGLVQREETSFAGPVVYDLVYARLNDGLTFVAAPEQSFTVSLDGATYAGGATATARLTLRHTLPEAASLTFPSGQRYDVVVRNAKGDIVYQWSRGKAFTQIFAVVTLSGEKSWVVAFPVPADPGKYTVEAWLSSDPVRFRGQAGIEVK